MYVCLYVYLPACSQSVFLPACLSACLPACLSACLSVCLSVYEPRSSQCLCSDQPQIRQLTICRQIRLLSRWKSWVVSKTFNFEQLQKSVVFKVFQNNFEFKKKFQINLSKKNSHNVRGVWDMSFKTFFRKRQLRYKIKPRRTRQFVQLCWDRDTKCSLRRRRTVEIQKWWLSKEVFK